MPIRLLAPALVSFLLWNSGGNACGQAVATVPSPSVEGAVVSDREIREQREWSQWNLPSLSENAIAIANGFRQGHVYYSAELLLLEANQKPFFAQDAWIAASRFQLGWERPSGFGLRAGYMSLDIHWNLNHGPEGTLIDATSGYGLDDFASYFNDSVLAGRDIDTYSLEVYQRFQAGHSELLFGAGPTFVRNRQQFEILFDTGLPGGDYSYLTSNETSTGAGISLFGELRRPLWVREHYELDFLLSGRTSYVPGEFELETPLLNMTLDDKLWIHTGSVGMEWLFRHKRVLYRVRGLFETQQWNSTLIADQAFTGGSLSFGLDW